MSSIARPLFDPFAPARDQTEDAFSKGMISRADADALNFASAFVELNRDFLAATFPGKAVSVVADDGAPDGVALYPGASVYEAENNARQFGHGRPYSTWNPFGSLPRIEGAASELARRLVLLGGLRAAVGASSPIGLLLQDTPPPGPRPLTDEERERIRQLLADIEDKLANELPDAEFAEKLGTRFENLHTYTGGKVVSGGFKNFKDWFVDTGSSTSMITQENFDLLKKKGAEPMVDGEEQFEVIGGVVTLKKYRGITMQFVRTGADGKPELVSCDVPLAVGTADLLGQDQRKETGTRYADDPAEGTAELKARPKPAAPKKK